LIQAAQGRTILSVCNKLALTDQWGGGYVMNDPRDIAAHKMLKHWPTRRIREAFFELFKAYGVRLSPSAVSLASRPIPC